MSRLIRYKESLDRFIKDRSCLFETDSIPNANINSILYNSIKNSNKILAILLLTIMNNQNKKKHISTQGYHAAATIEFLNLMIEIIDRKESFISDYGGDNYNKLTNYLMICANKSICENINSIKIHISGDASTEIFLTVMNIFNKKVSYNNMLDDFNFEFNDTTPKNDTLDWYLKNNVDVSNKFKTLNQIKKESYLKYLDKKIGSLCEMAAIIGWVIGCGDINSIDNIKVIAKHFTIIYKLSKDFDKIEDDILNSDGFSINYVVNYGLQDSYEAFMKHKQKFLEDVMVLDIYTSTIKEIVSYIENKVDSIIDQTSPDLKSNFSNIVSFAD
jgi:hypothetical protein